MSRRPSLHTPFQPQVVVDIYSDSRFHGPQGPARHVRIPQVTSQGGGAIARSEDGLRCVVAGKDSLRILRVSEPGVTQIAEHKSAIGRGGYRLDASRNLWTGSGLKIDSASTDVVWGHGNFNNKILTSARNGELIMWDLNKSGPTKYERRVRQHVRSIHKIAYSTVLRDYCITGSADGDIRVWDLRNLTDCVMKIRHPTAVRSVVFSPVQWQPRHAVTGLDNGNIYRWDLNMGQRGQLDRIPLAHSGPILSLDWMLPRTYTSTTTGRSSGSSGSSQSSNWYSNMGSGLFDDLNGLGTSVPMPTEGDGSTGSMGWLASGGLDHCVKVWDMTPPAGDAHISRKPVYTMYTSFPVRRVGWRPNYECELVVSSYQDVAAGAQTGQSFDSSTSGLGLLTLSSSPKASFGHFPSHEESREEDPLALSSNPIGQPIEIWDVRRGYVAKWTVRGSAVEGGVTDVVFADSHTLWAQHYSGTFSQLDLRYSMRTLDSIPRTAATWDPIGSLVFVSDCPKTWEIPYDDVNPDRKTQNKRKQKGLGSKPYKPSSQTIGIMSGHGLVDDVGPFVKLAQGYVYQGEERTTICARNAEVAFDAGKHDAAQTWLLLASLLTNVTSPTSNTPAITLSPLPLANPKLPHSISAPASIPTIAHVDPPSNQLRSHSEETPGLLNHHASPTDSKYASASGPASRLGTDKSRTQSASSAGSGFLSPLRTTPASSTTPSPNRGSTPLPPLPSLTSAVFARRQSGAGLPMSLGSMPAPPVRSRLGSSYRRPSFKAPSLHSSIISEGDSRSFSHSSLKRVGEGALDDSDSEGSGNDGEHQHLESTAVSDTESPSLLEEDRGSVRRQSTSRPSPSTASSSNSLPHWHSRASSVQPSPLSRVAVSETWTEDEDERDEEDSPSPASTDSDVSSDELDDLPSPGLHPPHPLSRRQSSSRSRRSSARSSKKSRSRSSTVASLSVSLPPSAMSSRGRLTKQSSHSSIRTVTAIATPTSLHGPDRMPSGDYDATSSLHRDATVRDLTGAITTGVRGDTMSMKSASYYSRSRPRSEGFSNEDDHDADMNGTSIGQTETPAITNSQAAARDAILQSEARIREVGWRAMKDTMEVLVDEGDVQTCAMLALVAPIELGIKTGRMVRLVESYIELLMRLRLHGPAAYIRKHATSQDIRSKTEVGTTIETVCGRCRKPLLQAALKPANSGKPSGSFSFCLKCRASTTKCAICHLPVRALAFTCPICMHGGHQECYQQYYSRRPLVAISTSTSVTSHGSDPVSGAPFGQPHRSARISESRGRGRASSSNRDGSGSDDGTSVREGDESLSAFKTVEGNAGLGFQASLQGRPCAAGCGHHCWATN